MQQDPSFARLQEEHVKGINVTKERIHKWKQYLADYEALRARLATLPDKISRDITVPFGRFAFMSGELYHTNEITVLLGDDWFVKCSAKHSIEIVNRRKKHVERLLEEEEKVLSDLESRHAFTSEFKAASQEHEDVVEIREDYVPEEEEEWKERHHKSLLREKKQKKQNKKEKEKGSDGQAKMETSDMDVWKRLEELEQEEMELARETGGGEEGEEGEDEGMEGEGEEEGTEVEEVLPMETDEHSKTSSSVQNRTALITFSHTAAASTEPPTQLEDQQPPLPPPSPPTTDGAPPLFKSPSDIFRHFRDSNLAEEEDNLSGAIGAVIGDDSSLGGVSGSQLLNYSLNSQSSSSSSSSISGTQLKSDPLMAAPQLHTRERKSVSWNPQLVEFAAGTTAMLRSESSDKVHKPESYGSFTATSTAADRAVDAADTTKKMAKLAVCGNSSNTEQAAAHVLSSTTAQLAFTGHVEERMSMKDHHPTAVSASDQVSRPPEPKRKVSKFKASRSNS